MRAPPRVNRRATDARHRAAPSGVERCQFHTSASQGCAAVDGLRSNNGKALLGYFNADGVAGAEHTRRRLKLDLPTMNGIREVTGFPKEMRRARDAKAYELSLPRGDATAPASR